MSGQSPNRRRYIAGRLADRQHGVVSRTQLLTAGMTIDEIDHAVSTRRLRPLLRGVYAVGHVALRREGWWKAALLVGGDGAALSHRSAAVAWDLQRGPLFPIELIVPGDRGRKHDEIVPHRMRLHPEETLLFDGLRVTTPPRTIVDCAGVMSGRPLRGLVERAQDLRRFDAKRVEATLDRNPRRFGRRQLSDLLLLIQPDSDGARSHLERLFLKAMRKAGITRPEVNAPIAGRRRDFVWCESRLVVEVDGHRWHSSRSAMRRDRRRDRELTALGWRPVRFTYEDVAFEPAEVGREVKGLL